MTTNCPLILPLCCATLILVLLLTPGVDGVDGGDCNVTCEYTAWALDANCRGRGLEAVPPECGLCENMDLRNNQLEWLEAGAFQGYATLRYLYLEFNLIQGIAEGAFRGCSSLGYIYLQYNILRQVGPGAFSGAVALKRLFLNQNEIVGLHRDAFRGLGRLERLYLADNNLASLDAAVFQQTRRLQYLHIGDNSLAELPQGLLDNLGSLTDLNLEENRLRSLDGTLFRDLTNLVKLALAGNRIHALGPLPVLPRLSVLDLARNDLGDLAALDAGLVEGLSALFLGGNAEVECGCSAVAVQDWLLGHTSEAHMSDARLNVTCHLPERLRGQSLRGIPSAALCPEWEASVPLPTLPAVEWIPTTTKPRPLPPVDKQREGHTGGSDSDHGMSDSNRGTSDSNRGTSDSNRGTSDSNRGMLDSNPNTAPKASGIRPVVEQEHPLVYIGVGVATFVVVALALLLVRHCMRSQTRRYYATPVNGKPERRPPPRRQPAAPQEHPMPPAQPRLPPRGGEPEDYAIYEPVGGGAERRRPFDSAFSSLEDMTRDEEAEGAPGLPPSAASQEPGQGYLSMEMLRAMQQTPPAHGTEDGERAPLVAEQLGRAATAADSPSQYPAYLILNGEETGLLAKNAVLVPLGLLPQNLALALPQGQPPPAYGPAGCTPPCQTVPFPVEQQTRSRSARLNSWPKCPQMNGAEMD